YDSEEGARLCSQRPGRLPEARARGQASSAVPARAADGARGRVAAGYGDALARLLGGAAEGAPPRLQDVAGRGRLLGDRRDELERRTGAPGPEREALVQGPRVRFLLLRLQSPHGRAASERRQLLACEHAAGL